MNNKKTIPKTLARISLITLTYVYYTLRLNKDSRNEQGKEFTEPGHKSEYSRG